VSATDARRVWDAYGVCASDADKTVFVDNYGNAQLAMGEGRMGEQPNDHGADWRATVGLSESHDEFARLDRAVKVGGPPPSGPSPLATAPVIIDTDIGGDPDDAVALAVAALTVPELALVITTDELRGERARFARHHLDLLGRPDVPVVRGADLGNERYFCVDGLTVDYCSPSVAAHQPSHRRAAVIQSTQDDYRHLWGPRAFRRHRPGLGVEGNHGPGGGRSVRRSVGSHNAEGRPRHTRVAAAQGHWTVRSRDRCADDRHEQDREPRL